MVAPAPASQTTRGSETAGLEKQAPENGGPSHEGLTIEPSQKGEKVK